MKLLLKTVHCGRPRGPGESTGEGAFWPASEPPGAAPCGGDRRGSVSAHTAPGKEAEHRPAYGSPAGKARAARPRPETPGACSGTDSGVPGTTPKGCLECYLILWRA